MTVLVDSDVLIEVTRGRNQEVLDQWSDLSLSEGAVLCSAIAVAELWHSARPREHEVLNRLFESLLCIPVDANVGYRAGEFLRKYQKSHGLQLGDALIAASAVLNGALLWTRNKKHYPVPSVQFF